MNCKKCGKEIKEGNSFCTNCGTPVNFDVKVGNENNIKESVVINEDAQQITKNTDNKFQKEKPNKNKTKLN